MIRGVVYTHADLGAAFCRTVESMLGPQGDLQGISNEGLSGKSVQLKLEETIADGEGESIIFTALFGGSCWQAAEKFSRERGEIRHITGVNLPMLISFVNKRETTSLDELTDLLGEYGRKGILP